MHSLQEDKYGCHCKDHRQGANDHPAGNPRHAQGEASDLPAWEVNAAGRVEVRRVQPVDVEYLRAIEGTLSEWADPKDEEAYRDL